MKKHFLLLLLSVLLATSGWAQNTTVTLGTDITSSYQLGPVMILGGQSSTQGTMSRHAALYTAAEIKATPFTGRAITKIAWYKEDTARFVSTTNSYIKIYFKQTTAANLGNILGVNWATESTGATEVYSVTMPVISSGAGWKEFVLPVPYMWDGASGLEVLVDWFGIGSTFQATNWRYSAYSGTKSAIVSGPSPAMTGSPNRPNTQITFSVFNNDAGITAITAPTAQVTPNTSVPVQVTLQNFGFNAMTSATIGWKINNVAQPDYTWNGSLTNGQTATGITIGNKSFPVGAHTIKVYPKTVNGVPDAFAINDTATFQVVACNALAGNYTINKNAAGSGTNFTSFADAASLLNSCGVSGPVTFTVAAGSGPYNEALNLTNIPGTSATNTITFEGNGNTITSANAAVIKLDRANYVKFNNLIITQTSTATLCYGVQLLGPSDYATVSNSTINMPSGSNANVIGILLGTGSNSNTAGNYSSNSVFSNNTINNGYYSIRVNGLAVTGSSPTGAANNRFANNQFRDFYSNGIYMTNADGAKIEGNTFTRPTATALGNFSGVYLSTGCISTLVNKNRFHNPFGAVTSPTSGVTPITIEAAAPAGSENIIKNNLFYNLNNTGNITGISMFSAATGAYIYHNTFSIENPNRPVSNTSTIKGINLSGSGANVKLLNNIVTINMPGTGAKHAIYLSVAPAATFESNRNVLYLASGQTNAHTGYLTSNRTALTDWQAANTPAFDANSVAFNPAFADLANGNLKPTSPDVNNIGQALALVTDDFNGTPRSTTTPDPGAIEFDLGTNDAGVTAFITPTKPALPATALPVQVQLKNFGTANLNSVTIGWKVDGVNQPDFNWTGTLAANAVSPVSIGNFTFAAGSHTVCAWTKLPNNTPDANAANDSTCLTLNACAPLAGNYTINKSAAASATNFISFSAAAERLHNCGVAGRTIISVVNGSGPYTEQVELLNIPGASATNSIIFQGNGNTLNGTPTAAKTAVVKMDNADFIRINNLNITLTGNGSVSNPTFSAIQMVNGSDNDTISNCTITMPQTAATNAYVVGIFAGVAGASPSGADLSVPGTYTSNSAFLNNTIKGGLVGIKLNGTATGTGAVNNKIVGNVLEDAYAYGLALNNVDGTLVENNEIRRPVHNNPGTFYAISLAGLSKNNLISKNRIHTLWGGQFGQLGNSYGFHFSGVGAPAGPENKVINNLYRDAYTPQYAYGIYNDGSSGLQIYHNTIALINNGGFYGYYQTATAVQNVKFNNNIISVTNGGGTLEMFGMYLKTAIETNNNAIYLNPILANAKFGHYAGTDYNTLATWKTANTNAFDQQSVDANPAFKSNSTVNLVPSNPLVNNIGKPVAVAADILNNPRSTTTPDPGAYEFTPSTAEVAVLAITSPGSGCGLSNQQTVSVTVQNLASGTVTSLPIQLKVDNAAPITETFTGSLAFNATATYTFTAKANLSAQGAHKIKVTALLPNDSDNANDTLSLKVVNYQQATLPVALNFETPASGLGSMAVVTKANSAVTEGAAASNGTGSTKGLIMDGVDNTNWVLPGGTANAWNMNPDNFSAAYLCLSTANTLPTDTLRLAFDLKQLFKTANANTNFRITVNGTQVGPTYRPPFSGGTPVWQRIKVDLSAYLNLPTIQIGFESSVKEAYANGTGTANFIDNVQILRLAGPTGIKEALAANRVQVYPNPSNGTFKVAVAQAKEFTVTVADLTGKVLKTQTVKAAETQLKLEGYAKGIYLLQLVSEGQTTTCKLVIQ